jgi:hypothetical protein
VAVRADDDLDFLGAVAATAVGTARELEREARAAQRAALQERRAAHHRVGDVYIADFIPFARGARLFGRACGATSRWSAWPPASVGREGRHPPRI